MKLSKQPIIGVDTIAKHVDTLAAQITADYAGEPLTLVAVLKGALPFAADLMRRLSGEVSLDFVRARSYDGTTTTGRVQVQYMPELDLRDRNVLLVEDILDTGRTALAIMEALRKRKPRQLRLVTLLDKPARRTVSITADYTGIIIDDRFVVGYGLDYKEQYRHLPAIHEIGEDTP